MLRGLLLGGLVAGVGVLVVAGIRQGLPGVWSALAGWAMTVVLMLTALVGIKLVVGLSGVLPLFGAIVAFTATLLVMAIAWQVFDGAAWLIRPTFALSAAITVIATQAGIAVGLLRARTPLLGEAA